ncbi:MAG: hypothetical protein AVDCRST_MAG48-2787 [uncultured Friedmanniella sp.]|uniref:Uncharacterized protein n=1 Tax=uncultured Friedmanniella sp. TaxID=335381 RepID=A0A6J4L5T7_9ACTN|nr:MAG: hypothetical protein AVDCRST_MAG48-2787 [uncultured Friedmanniella sp.]
MGLPRRRRRRLRHQERAADAHGHEHGHRPRRLTARRSGPREALGADRARGCSGRAGLGPTTEGITSAIQDVPDDVGEC